VRASIIIPAYNAEKTIAECLQACLAQTYPDFEIVVVDDGSTDRTPEIARAFPNARLISKENAGPAAARNSGAKAAMGEVLVYTDSDCVPHPDWLVRLLDGLTDGVVAVGGTYDCANPESRLARVIQAEIAIRHRRFAPEVDFLGSFNVAYRKEGFDRIGGFNEEYRQASGEDNDLAYRLQEEPGSLRFCADAVVSHYHPEKLLPYLRTQACHGYWRVKLYRDHPNRAVGDQYARLPDLLAPPGTILIAMFLPIALGGWWLGWEAPVAPGYWAVGMVVTYLALQVPIAWRLRQELPIGDLLYFRWVSTLRDMARAVGLIRGIWHFRILGRRS